MYRTIIIIFIALVMVGCQTFQANVTSFRPPQDYSNHANINGLLIACEILNSPELSKKQFNVDLNAIGVIPIRLIIKNNGRNEVVIEQSQIFGFLSDGSMYNTYALHQSIRKIRDSEIGKGMATGLVIGTLAGAAVGAGVGAAIGGDSDSAGRGATMGATSGAITGTAAGADTIASYIKKEMWRLDWGERAIYPGYLVQGFVFLPKAEYKELQIGVFNISQNKMEQVKIKFQ